MAALTAVAGPSSHAHGSCPESPDADPLRNVRQHSTGTIGTKRCQFRRYQYSSTPTQHPRCCWSSVLSEGQQTFSGVHHYHCPSRHQHTPAASWHVASLGAASQLLRTPAHVMGAAPSKAKPPPLGLKSTAVTPAIASPMLGRSVSPSCFAFSIWRAPCCPPVCHQHCELAARRPCRCAGMCGGVVSP